MVSKFLRRLKLCITQFAVIKTWAFFLHVLEEAKKIEFQTFVILRVWWLTEVSDLVVFQLSEVLIWETFNKSNFKAVTLAGFLLALKRFDSAFCAVIRQTRVTVIWFYWQLFADAAFLKNFKCFECIDNLLSLAVLWKVNFFVCLHSNLSLSLIGWKQVIPNLLAKSCLLVVLLRSLHIFV